MHSEYLSEHPYFKARRDRYRLSSGKIVDPYFVVELPPSAAAMAITMNNEIIFVEQYRHPVGKTLVELPGGFIDEGEDPRIAIRRELLEETGYSFDDIQPLGITAANPGVLSNITHLFLARGGRKVTGQSLDANEEIALKFVPVAEGKEMLKNGLILQSMHALCLYLGFDLLEK